jgi:putative flippase GtrA
MKADVLVITLWMIGMTVFVSVNPVEHQGLRYLMATIVSVVILFGGHFVLSKISFFNEKIEENKDN